MRRATLSIICLVAILFSGLAAPLARAGDNLPANATVSFGSWQTDPPLDRFPPNDPTPRLRNQHELIPHAVTVTAGGSVNFIIGGFHQPIVYGDMTQPEDIDVDTTTTTTGPTPSPAVVLIADATNRIYRGLDPSLQPLDRSEVTFLQDRVEAVYFPNPGTYLVICGIRGHFVNDGMFGFVTVVPKAIE
jgi:plastocyanin